MLSCVAVVQLPSPPTSHPGKPLSASIPVADIDLLHLHACHDASLLLFPPRSSSLLLLGHILWRPRGLHGISTGRVA
jgi:hypothetical protein